MPAPPIGGAASSQGAITDLLAGPAANGMTGAGAAGGSPDQARQQLMALMQQIREFGSQIEQIGQTLPALQPHAEKIMAILQQMVMAAAAAGSAMGSPESSSAVPTAGVSMGGQ